MPVSTRRMQVLALVTDAYGTGGGIAQYNRDLLEALAAAESCGEIAVLARRGRIVEHAAGSCIRQIGVAEGKLAFLWSALMSVWQLPRPTVIFCGHLFMAPLAVLVSWLTGAPVWLQLHGIDAWQRPGPLLQLAVERVQLTTAVSRYTRQRFLAWARCHPASVRVLPNTVAKEFTPGPVPATLQQRYGTAGKQVLLTVSRLAASEQYKGHEHVMDALSRLGPAHPNLCYLVAGEGDDKARLQAIARRLHVEDRVHFIGYVPDAELPDLYRLADIFVMPSVGEGFGIVFLQALASGTAAIGTDADGSRDPLRDGSAGVLVSLQQPDALVVAIAELLAGKRATPGAAAVFQRDNFARHAGLLLAAVCADKRIVPQQDTP